jgi:hypothetical protein
MDGVGSGKEIEVTRLKVLQSFPIALSSCFLYWTQAAVRGGSRCQSNIVPVTTEILRTSKE